MSWPFSDIKMECGNVVWTARTVRQSTVSTRPVDHSQTTGKGGLVGALQQEACFIINLPISSQTWASQLRTQRYSLKGPLSAEDILAGSLDQFAKEFVFPVKQAYCCQVIYMCYYLLEVRQWYINLIWDWIIWMTYIFLVLNRMKDHENIVKFWVMINFVIS